ncbi:MAG: penicillin acylase family protein, partial [Armatimonadetes bacterium]|nr:penicillin acylase family protein [Anaerolineae bacterium]
MKRLRLILGILLLILLLVAIGGALFVNDLTRGMLPQLDGEARLPGLSAEVTVKRDAWGVPHIYASSASDLFAAQGYIQAQDRWWQMEFARATGDGRLQELTGKNADLMGSDVFIRTIGWRRAAERDLRETYDAETLAMLEAFTSGVNAYISGKSGGDLALEYGVLGLTGVNIPVKPWTVGDTVVWQKVMAWDLSDKLADRTRQQMVDDLGVDAQRAYEPPYPYDSKPTILQAADLPPMQPSLLGATALGVPAQTVAATGETSLTFAGGMLPGAAFAFGQGEGIGSNNWVVSGALSETGMPLLANDPHLGIQLPSVWYEVGLHCRPVSAACPYDVQGFAFAPFPGVVIGHNDRIAWGFTNVGPDVMDLYRIKVNPQDDLQYEWDSQWRDMTAFTEKIYFGDAPDPVTIIVRETHLGPIITDNALNADGLPMGVNNENPLALRWSALDPSQVLRALLLLNRAQNWDDFREALSYFDAPSQNIIYADVDGNIGYQTPGLIPVRAASNSGLLLLDGTAPSDEWRGYIPYDLLPRVYNPESGFIHSANQALVPLEYYDWLKSQLSEQFGEDINPMIGQDWDYGYR